jgi:hypothetical protein
MSKPERCLCPDDSGSCEWCLIYYCEHDDVCEDEFVCLNCGEDLREDLMASAYDRAKDLMKYGED